MKKKQHPLIKRILIFILSIAILMLSSYWNARNKAEKIFKPFLDKELYYYGTRFQILTLCYENNKIIKWYGPNWNVAYDHQTVMMTGPLSIRYNLFGKILESSPSNLLNEVLPKRLKER